MAEFKIHPELRKAITNNDLVLFVGAGLSSTLTNAQGNPIKGWSNLVSCIVQDLVVKGYEADYLKPSVEKQDPIDVLRDIEQNNAFTPAVIRGFVKEFFTLAEDNNLELHKKLFRLSHKIITTNYDTAFENAVPSLRRNTAYKGRNFELTTHKDRNSAFLFKLHGCYESADSMILFPSDYTNLYDNPEKDAEHSLLVLKNIILNKTILFIGVGMGDFQINSIFKQIKDLQKPFNQKHFIITKTNVDSSLDFLSPIPIGDFGEIPSIIDALLAIKQETESRKPDEVKSLRKQLEEAHNKIEQLRSDNEKPTNTSDNQGKNLELKALKYFIRGVEFSLSDEPLSASKEYEIATDIKPDYHNAWYNWGIALSDLAKTKGGKEAEDLYQQALEKYKKATDIKPDDHQAWNNWGIALQSLANTKAGTAAEALYQEAFEKYKDATDIKPDDHQAWNNWGIALKSLANTKAGTAAEALYQEAFEKYKKATDFKPDSHQAWYNWGIALQSLANTKAGTAAEALYQQAFEKYKDATDFKPDSHQAWHNWGSALQSLANTKAGTAAEDLYQQAEEKYHAAIEHGGQSYNLACLYALQGKKDEALKVLAVSLSKHEITAEFVEKDDDWKDLLTDADFMRIIAKHKTSR